MRAITPIIACGSLAFMTAGCATPYAGPVEITRFVAPTAQSAGALGSGPITVVLAEDSENKSAAPAYLTAVANQLTALGYSVQPGAQAAQTAIVSVEREPFTSVDRGRSPVSVGVGGSTGSYGSGVGLGVGFNLGGGQKPREVTSLSVRINSDETLWEGRSTIVTSTDAALSEPDANADILALGLFQDFPGGNGETTSIKPSDLAKAP